MWYIILSGGTKGWGRRGDSPFPQMFLKKIIEKEEKANFYVHEF